MTCGDEFSDEELDKVAETIHGSWSTSSALLKLTPSLCATAVARLAIFVSAGA